MFLQLQKGNIASVSLKNSLDCVLNFRVKRTVQIDSNTVEIEERGVKLRLTVVDTPGFGDAIDTTDSFKEIIKYIDLQFDRYSFRNQVTLIKTP